VFTARISVSAVQACGQQYFVGTIDQLESKQAIITATLDGKIISCNQNVRLPHPPPRFRFWR
jgi:hypothetical protein